MKLFTEIFLLPLDLKKFVSLKSGKFDMDNDLLNLVKKSAYAPGILSNIINDPSLDNFNFRKTMFLDKIDNGIDLVNLNLETLISYCSTNYLKQYFFLEPKLMLTFENFDKLAEGNILKEIYYGKIDLTSRIFFENDFEVLYSVEDSLIERLIYDLNSISENVKDRDNLDFFLHSLEVIGANYNVLIGTTM